MKRSTYVPILAAMFLSACSVWGRPSSVTSEQTLPTVRIGVVLPMSGPAAAYGEDAKGILDFEAETHNAEAEKNGYRVELVYEDGKCEGAAASAAFQKLTDVDGVKAILWGLCSSESIAMAPLLDTKKDVILISPYSSSPDIEGLHPRLFSFSYDDNVTGEGVAKELGKFRKVAIISEQNDFNQGIYKVVANRLKKDFPQTEIGIDEWFAKGTTDFRNQLEKIRNSWAEAVFLNPNGGVTAEALLRQIAEMKGWKPQFVSHVAYMDGELRAKAPEASEGMVLFDAPTVNSPDFLEYQDRIVARKGSLKSLAGYFTQSSIDSLAILLDLTKRHGGDAEKIRNSLSSETFEGWLGKIRFDGHSFVRGVSSSRFVVRNGASEASR